MSGYSLVTIHRIVPVIILVLALSGFRLGLLIGAPNWQEINAVLDEDYPEIVHMSTPELAFLISEGTAIYLIDVRKPEEFAVSHLKGAIHYKRFTPEKLPQNALIIAYCSVGLRSAKYARELQRSGHTNVRNLRGSIFDWANRGFPLYADDLLVDHVHPFGKRWGILLDEKYHKYNQ